MAQQMVFLCEDGHTVLSQNALTGETTARCDTGFGAWHPFYDAGEAPVMDIVSVLIAAGICFAWILGFMSGKQR